MKRLIIFLGLFLYALTAFVSAQESKQRIAVFDPAISGNNFDEGAGVIIREMVSSVIVNTGRYIIIERSLIDRILKEQKFSNSGAVDDSQISQIGKLAGASKVVLSVLSSAGNKGLLSLKLIDVESAGIESQKTQLVDRSEILDIVMPLALEVIGEQPTSAVPTPENLKGGSTGTSIKDVVEREIGALSGDKNQHLPLSPPVIPAKSDEQKVTERIYTDPIYSNQNNEEKKDFSASFPSKTSEDITLFFAGFSHSKNPDVEIYVDGVHIGNGKLNQGFSVSFSDKHAGKHEVKIKWSGTISSKTYEINTENKKRFVFEYARGGFGYEFKLKK